MPARIASATARPDPLHAEQRPEQAPLGRRREAVQPQRLVRDEVRVDVELHLARQQRRPGRRARQHLVADAADVDDDRVVVLAPQLAAQEGDHRAPPRPRRPAALRRAGAWQIAIASASAASGAGVRRIASSARTR